MLTMSRSCNASEQGSWKDSYRSTADSVESFEDSVDSDNSSTSSSQTSARQSGANIQPPIGCITTHSVSAVIRPEKKMPPIDPLQFVKIQKNELSKKAVEQIKLAEEVKITKEKIKEVEEEWQNNLMSWKSKRKLTKNNSEDESQLSRNTNRKTKTFTEILNEKARSGGRIGYNLHRYAAVEDEEADFRSAQKEYMQQYETSPVNSDSNPEDEMTLDQLSFDATESNLNRLLKPNANADSFNDEDEICRNGLGEVVVYDTTLLEEFSVNKSNGCEIEQTNGASADNRNDDIFNIGNTQQVIIPSLDSFESAQIHYHYQPEPSQNALSHESPREMAVPSVEDKNSAHLQSIPQKVHVPINDWKSNHPKHPKQAVPSSDDDTPPQQPLHNSSFEVEDEEEELDEELERLRLDQERSFKAKLYAFENLAKQEEEAARKATESYRRRQQSRAKLAAERSRSLGNIQQSSSQVKVPVTTSYSISSSSIPVSQAATSTESSRTTKAQFEKQSKSMQNLNSEMPVSSISINPAVSNSTIYNFTNKDVTKSLDLDSLSAHSELSETKSNSSINSIQPKSQIKQVESVPKSSPPVSQISISTSQTTQQQQQAQNIYENITPLGLPQQSQLSPVDPVSDSNAIRNASQKLLQQQQQIYQNQPLPVQYQQQPPQLYPPEHYSTVPTSANFGYQYEHANMQSHHVPSMPADHPVQPTDNILNDKVINPVPIRGYAISDEVGLPPVQITKSNQSGSNKAPFTKAASLPVAAIPEEEHLYVNQNQLMLNPTAPNLNNQNFPPFEYHQNTPGYESYNNVNVHFHEPNYENQTLIQKRMEDVANGIYQPDQYSNQPVHPQQQQYPNAPNQYLYYPKPYSAANSTVKPIQAKQPQIVPNVSNLPRAVPNSQNVRYAQNNGSNGHRVAYNQNHWLLQEAELRRQLDSMESSSQRLKNPNAVQQPQPKSGGYLSVSGKKKCSSCMDELGKGCAAMVVESLSLYYHINCFRCSVCNVQLGNGTVGTDVRVRNNKLHCQNCYSNDEAGLKFSRV